MTFGARCGLYRWAGEALQDTDALYGCRATGNLAKWLLRLHPYALTSGSLHLWRFRSAQSMGVRVGHPTSSFVTGLSWAEVH
jgi:hypothetical protein